MSNDNNGPVLFIGSLLLLTALLTMGLVYAIVTSVEWAVDRDPEQATRQWTKDNHDQVARQTATWLVNNDPRLQPMGLPWVRSSVTESIQWKFEEPPTRTGSERHARAFASATIALPDQGTRLTTRVPWLFRLDQNARTAFTREKDQMKVERRARGIIAAPQWQQGTIITGNPEAGPAR